MKKHRFRALWVLLAAALSLTACGQAAANLDPNALLKEISEKYGNPNSLNMSVEIRMDLTSIIEGQSVRAAIELVMNAASIEKPTIKAKLDIGMSITTPVIEQSMSYTTYMMEENGKVIGYSASGDDSDYGAPVENGTVLGDAAEYAELNAINDFNYLTEPKIIGVEKLDGRDAIHLRAKMDAQKRFSEISAVAGNDMLEGSAMSMVILLLHEMNADLWIDEATHKPIKLTAELEDDSESLLSILEPLMRQEGVRVEFNAVEVNIMVMDYDAVGDFEVPEALKNSKPTITPGQGSDTSVPL